VDIREAAMADGDESAPERVEIVLVGWRRDGSYEGAVAYRRAPLEPGADQPAALAAESRTRPLVT
jgi:hypothetical protein